MAERSPDQPEIPGYQLVRPIGQGAYGTVWLARTLSGLYVALKIVWRYPFGSDPRPYEREFAGLKLFHRVSREEPRQLALLHLDRDDARGFFYSVMELADDALSGREIDPESYSPLTLKSWTGSGRRRPPEWVGRIGIDLADALAILHRRGLIHRDIKPSNIIFVSGVPKIADIGLLMEVDAPGTLVGTRDYMAPELFQENPRFSPASDVYALGKVLYVLGTGYRPTASAPDLGGNETPTFPRLPAPPKDSEARRLFFELNGVWTDACADVPTRRPTASEVRDQLQIILAGESLQGNRRLRRLARAAVRVSLITTPVAVITCIIAWFLLLKERDKNFALYQANLQQVALQLDRARLGPARQVLEEAKRGAGDRLSGGLELRLLEHQARGDSLGSLPGSGVAGEAIAFNANGLTLAVLRGTELTIHDGQTLEVWQRWTNVALFGGFAGNDRVFFSQGGIRGDPNRPLQHWRITQGRAAERLAELPGNLRPIRYLERPNALAYWDREASAEIRHWRPGLGSTRENTPCLEFPPDSWGPARWLDTSGRAQLHAWTQGADGTSLSVLVYVDAQGRALRHEFPRTAISAADLSGSGVRYAYAVVNTGDLIQTEVLMDSTISVTNRFSKITALAFSPDERFLACGGPNETLTIRDSHTLTEVHRRIGHSQPIRSIAWAPDGQRLASVDAEGEIRLWSLNELPSEPIRQWAGFVTGVAEFGLCSSPDESLLAVTLSSNRLACLDLTAHHSQRTVDGVHVPLGFSPDSSQLMALSPEGRLARLNLANFELEMLTPVLAHDDSRPANGRLSPDGKTLITWRHTNQLAVWTISRTPHLLHEYTNLDWSPYDLAFTPGKVLLLASRGINSDDAILVSLNLDTGAQEQPISVPFEAHSIAYDPQRRLIHLGTGFATLASSRDATRGNWLSHRSALTGSYAILPLIAADRLLVAGDGGTLAIHRLSDLEPLISFTHRLVPLGEHRLRSLLHLPQRDQVWGLTDDGRLLSW